MTRLDDISPQLESEAMEWARAEHPHALHLERALHWLVQLDSDASAALRIAALLHDIERAFPDPDSPYDGARQWDQDAYVRYHETRCAQFLAAWLIEHRADPTVARDAVELVLYHEEGGWREADLLQAADSLSFIDTMTPLITGWITTGTTTREGALAKLAAHVRPHPGAARARARPAADRGRDGGVQRGLMPSEWLQPATLDEALRLRREHGEDALVLAGGTFVGILLSTGFLPPPPAFLALRDVPDLHGVDVDGGVLVLGAMATHRAVETDPRVAGRGGRRWRAACGSSPTSACATRPRSAASWPTPTTRPTRRRCSPRSGPRPCSRARPVGARCRCAS